MTRHRAGGGGRYSGGHTRPLAAAQPLAGPSGVFGIGVDVLMVSRMRKLHERHRERLEQRLLHPAERARLASVRDPVNFIAKCFAVKEAFVKALGTGFRGIAHDEVGWTRGERGRPELVTGSRLGALLRARGIGAAHLTLSDEQDLVCAVVVLERG